MDIVSPQFFMEISMKRSLLLFCALSMLLLPALALRAQVTTGAMNGVVTDKDGKPLAGARVLVTHEPSGTKYGGITGATGRYNVPGLRPGGPYSIVISAIGMKTEKRGDIQISLGDPYVLNTKLNEGEVKLSEITVISQKNSVMTNERTGAASNVSKEIINSVPTISRNIVDYGKLDPRSNGRSFGGQDDRLNSLTIDGSVFNNTFGLSSTPAGQTGQSPISLDAIEQLQINVAPYDVRQGGFTGAGLSAVTRSGDNEFRASAFYNFRSQAVTGTKADTTEFNTRSNNQNQFSSSQVGFRVGGPLIQDKLFFFVNAEHEERVAPATTFRAARDGDIAGVGSIARVRAGQLDTLRSFLISNYQYDPGVYDGYNLNTFSNKATLKFNYNIDDNNKASIRFQYLRSASDQLPSNSGASGARRLTNQALNFSGNGYTINNDIYSGVFELNSVISSGMSNNFVASFTANRDYRSSTSTPFPQVDILLNGQTLTSFGYELFTPFNKLDTDTWQVTDNLTFYVGDHTITAGITAEAFTFTNGFNQRYYGYYRFNSLDDFYTNKQPVQFSQTYSALPGGAVPLAVTKASQIGAYVQDEFNVSNNFKLTYGLRIDAPIFGNTALVNPIVEAATFADKNGNISEKSSTGNLPNTNLLISPRVGFNWDVNGDRTTQIRGGSGIFSGRPPFVWLSNIITNNGVTAGDLVQNSGFTTNPKTFSPDVTKYIPSNAATNLPPTFTANTVVPGFRFPQLWRTNLAIDQELPGGLIGTLEGIYSKNLSSVYYRDANLRPATTTFAGADNRPRFPASIARANGRNTDSAARINFPVVGNYVLDNTDLGYTYSITAQIQKPFKDNWYAMIAYNYSVAQDITSAGSIAQNSWTGNPIVNNPNAAPLSFSDNDNPHRIIANASYRIDEGEFAATTISLFYELRTNFRYSYTYVGDMNGDLVQGNDLMYVPRDANDPNQITFTQFVAGGKTWTPALQSAELEKFISNDPYLSTRRGQYAERNGALRGWVGRLDLTVTQDISFLLGEKKNTLQIRLDLLNAGNLVNSKWGVADRILNSTPLIYTGITSAGVPTFRINESAAGQGLPPSALVPGNNYPTDVWQMQFGVRYTFN
jgi:hypothetical protein